MKMWYNYELLIEYVDEDKIITSKDTFLTRDTRIHFYCMKCNTETEKGFRYIVKKGGPFCEPCTKESRNKKQEITIQKKYGEEYTNISQVNEIKEKKKETTFKNFGVEFPGQSEEIKNKIKETNIEKYNVLYVMQNPEIKEKIKQTNIKKYGVPHAMQNPEIREKARQTNIIKYNGVSPMHSEIVREKFKQTMLARHGVTHPSKLDWVKQKKIDTCMKNYNVENPLQSEEIKEKIKKTVFDKYGCEYTAQSTEFKEKSRLTCLDKYGCDYPMQDPDIAERCSKAAYQSKPYTFPSGRIEYVQGYEPLALDLLIDTGMDEDKIIVKNKDTPEIWYMDPLTPSKFRRHYPDIYIPSEKWLIEVKSTWTYKRDKYEVHTKKKAAVALGYLYQIWIMDSKGEILEIL